MRAGRAESSAYFAGGCVAKARKLEPTFVGVFEDADADVFPHIHLAGIRGVIAGHERVVAEVKGEWAFRLWGERGVPGFKWCWARPSVARQRPCSPSSGFTIVVIAPLILMMQVLFLSFSRPLNGRTRTATFTFSACRVPVEHDETSEVNPAPAGVDVSPSNGSPC